MWTPVALSEPINILTMWASPSGDLYVAGTSTLAPVGKARLFKMAAGTTTWVLDALLSAAYGHQRPHGNDDLDERRRLDDGQGLGRHLGSKLNHPPSPQPADMWIDEAPVFDKAVGDPNPTFWGLGAVGDTIFVSTKVRGANACTRGTDDGPSMQTVHDDVDRRNLARHVDDDGHVDTHRHLGNVAD